MDGVSISLAAFWLGVLHALEPGHGKTLMAGTLIGSQRRWMDPLVIAASTAFGHALGIILFVSVSFLLAHELAAEELRHQVELGAGVIVILTGAHLLRKVIATSRSGSDMSECSSCSCNSHRRAKSKHHLPLVGFLIGIVPCPSALAISLSATKVGSLYQAVALCCLFAFGVAITIATIGLAITHSAGRFERFVKQRGAWTVIVRLMSPCVIIALGCLMVAHAAHH